MVGGFPTAASPRAEPCSGLQPPAQGWGSRGSSLLCPYLLSSAEKGRESWLYLLETCKQQAPNLPSSKLRLLKDKVT